MWGGYYAAIAKEISKFSKEEDLLGLSTYLEFKESDLTDPEYKECLDKVRFIRDNSKSWKKLDVWDEAEKYFEINITQCVKYENFLVNHTRKLAIDLADYYHQSIATTQKGEDYAVDPIPVLTETGGGSEMLFFDGIAEETTEQLKGGWCGDLLQIVDRLPDGYSLINCCFTEVLGKRYYCYYEFGLNKEGYLLKDNKGNLFKALMLSLSGKRGPVNTFNVKEEENFVTFTPKPCDS